jgi:hypothetical protein
MTSYSPSLDETIHATDAVDLADSQDLRFIVAGRLTSTSIPLRRERAELTAALTLARQLRGEPRMHLERIAR